MNISIPSFTFLLILVLISLSCNRYPNFSYDHAVLISIDGNINRPASPSNSGEELLRMNMGTDGESFIDSEGLPIHSHYKIRKLNKIDIEGINKCINQMSVNDMTTECIPLYRDVIIYYSKTNEPIAWLSICFECKKMYLSTKTSNSKFKTSFKTVDCLQSLLKNSNFQ